MTVNPTFKFIFGKGSEDQSGRWVEGSLSGTENAYRFSADLMLRQGPTLSCQTVFLDVDRPFAPADFAAYLRLASTAEFRTVTRNLHLSELTDPAVASAILDAVAEAAELKDHVPQSKELEALGQRLAEARGRELLGLAFARFSGGHRSK
jgi:hypothetical protein